MKSIEQLEKTLVALKKVKHIMSLDEYMIAGEMVIKEIVSIKRAENVIRAICKTYRKKREA